jgi:ketosteroid isomerase-like protein
MSRPDVVRALYTAIAARDAAEAQRLVDEHFAEDVVLHEPASLPWGGSHEGRKRVGRMFVGLAAAPEGASPLDASSLRVERVAGDGDEVAALLRFTWTTPSGETVDSGAVEWFSFAGDAVSEVRAVYLDTVPLVGAATT